MLKFTKMHGLGNDFVIMDARQNPLPLDKDLIRTLGDRRRGIGFDQLIVLEQSAAADIFMRIYNPDGTEAGACGNATRCVADMIMAQTGKGACVVETVSGQLACEQLQGGLIRVNMGMPVFEWSKIPLSAECDPMDIPIFLPSSINSGAAALSMGNPHCVLFCEEAGDIPVDKIGPQIEHDPLFPDRTNVEFVSIRGPNEIRMRVWERGAGITEACGSGACAAAVAAIRRGLTADKVEVVLDGGVLEIEWRGNNTPVFMTGPVAYVFEGTYLHSAA